MSRVGGKKWVDATSKRLGLEVDNTKERKSTSATKQAQAQPENTVKTMRLVNHTFLRIRVANMVEHNEPVGVVPPRVQQHLDFVDEQDSVVCLFGCLSALLISTNMDDAKPASRFSSESEWKRGFDHSNYVLESD
eukprot:Lithocolla_globosa_v1_NODE_4444_length_1433_cov_3.379536.p2 type:complete len:135 gc:universal NODE_4444_length_1433_cov_3.379536:1343-939(-)